MVLRVCGHGFPYGGAVAAVVLPDANVLYSRTLRDWLLLLSIEGSGRMFQVTYTEDIMAETMYWIRKNNPDCPGTALTKIRDRIVDSTSGRIDSYDSGRDAEEVKDVFDRHVHAAAVAGQVDGLITSDTGFTTLPNETRDNLNYEIYTPDDFFLLVADSSSHVVVSVIRRQIQHFAEAGIDEIDLPGKLAEAQCPAFGQRVRDLCRHWLFAADECAPTLSAAPRTVPRVCEPCTRLPCAQSPIDPQRRWLGVRAA